MSELRKRLKESCPELAIALENSWQIAQTEWLPMVDAGAAAASLKSKKGKSKSNKKKKKPEIESFSSFPHLRNLENHLDRIILGYEQVLARKIQGQQNEPNSLLSPVEIYVILASVLFHDIGKIEGKERWYDNDKHGTYTEEILLGKDIANKKTLSVKNINKYWKHFPELGIPSLQLAKVIADICEYHTGYKENMQLPSTTAINPYGIVRCGGLAGLLLLVDEMDDSYNRVLPESLSPKEHEEFKADFRRTIGDVYIEPEKQTVFTVFVAKDKKECEERLDKLKGIFCKKKEPLEKIKGELAHLGIYINGWLLECDEHLYDEKGVESCEACFYPGYLENVVNEMWKMSAQVFGTASFTYENLAAEMRESNIEKIKIAVKRLSIIAKTIIDREERESGNNERKDAGIWAGRDRWKWLVRHQEKDDKKGTKEYCIYVSLKEIELNLKQLNPENNNGK